MVDEGVEGTTAEVALTVDSPFPAFSANAL